MHRVHIKITGIVQGVFFRANTQKEAVKLGLTGWVRNTSDGGVEAIAEGEKKALEEFIEWCRHGPPSAHVENVEIKWRQIDTAEHRNFEIRF